MVLTAKAIADLRSEGKHDESIETAFILIEKHPANAEIYYERAMTYIHRKSYTLAMIDLNECVRLEPMNPFRYSYRAYLKSITGDIQGSIDDYTKAIELDPEDTVAQNNIGLLLEKAGYSQMAKEHFNLADTKGYPSASSFKSTAEAVQSPQKTTFWSLIKYACTTREGIKELFSFMINGCKLSK